MIYEKYEQNKWNGKGGQWNSEYKEILTFEYFELGKYLFPYVLYPQQFNHISNLTISFELNFNEV